MARIRARGRGATAPPPVDPMDVLLAALTGTRRVYDTTYNNSALVTQGGGSASAVADVLGVGAPILFTGSPAWDNTAKTITTDGSTQFGEHAASTIPDMSGDWFCAFACALPTPGGQAIYFSDGTLSSYVSLGMDSTSLRTVSAGNLDGSGDCLPTVSNTGFSANLRMISHSHGGLHHPAATGPQAGNNVASEYDFTEVHGRGRSVNIVFQHFAAGTRKLTIGADPTHTTFAKVVFKTYIGLDHQPSLDEQLAIRTFMLTRGIVMDTSHNIAIFAGNSFPFGVNADGAGGVDHTKAYPNLMTQASAAGYPALAAPLPTSSYDIVVPAINGGQGQWISQTRGTSTRSKDLEAACAHALHTKKIACFDEANNDFVTNIPFVPGSYADQNAIGQIGVDSALKWLAAMQAMGITAIIKTLHKTNTSAVPDAGSPWNMGLNPSTRLNSEIRRCFYNDWIRKNAIAAGFADVWDAAGNVNFQHTTATYYASAAPHWSDVGHKEGAWAAGDSAYDPTYNAAYLAAWGVDLGITRTFKIGLAYVLQPWL